MKGRYTMKYFETIQTLEDLKKAYRKLIFKLHPDKGGSEEEFKTMKSEYDVMFVKLQKGSTNSKEKNENIDQYKDLIEQLIHFPNLDIDIVGTWVWVSGETKPIKEDLKKVGFHYSGKHYKWFYNGEEQKVNRRNKKTYDQIKEEYGCTSYKSSGYQGLHQ